MPDPYDVDRPTGRREVLSEFKVVPAVPVPRVSPPAAVWVVGVGWLIAAFVLVRGSAFLGRSVAPPVPAAAVTHDDGTEDQPAALRQEPSPALGESWIQSGVLYMACWGAAIFVFIAVLMLWAGANWARQALILCSWLFSGVTVAGGVAFTWFARVHRGGGGNAMTWITVAVICGLFLGSSRELGGTKIRDFTSTPR